MIRNYLLVTYRHFARNKLYTLLNISGLGLSLAACLTIGLFVQHELSYDRHFALADRIFRIGHTMPDYPDSKPRMSSRKVAQSFSDIFPLIQSITRYTRSQPMLLESAGFGAVEAELGFADEEFFSLFDFDWLSGNAATALKRPDSIVLTRSLAEKYLGTDFRPGQLLVLNNDRNLVVTGVIEDLPQTTHFKFKALLPADLNDELLLAQGMNSDNWGSLVYTTYALVPGAVVVPFLEDQIVEYAGNDLGELSGKLKFELKSIKRIYLDGDYSQNGLISSNLNRVKIFTAIGVSILAIAIINFMNMSTARASSRVVEVGMRSSLGASRKNLIRQFLAEAVVMVAFAMMLALALTELLLPIINSMLDMSMALDLAGSFWLLPSLLLVVLLLGLAAGSYPALFLTSMKPADALRGKGYKGSSGRQLRSLLVVLQFSISVALIVSAITIYRQMDFVRNMELGFSSEQMVSAMLPESSELNINTQWPAFRQELLLDQDILSVTHSLATPVPEAVMRTLVKNPDGSDQDLAINVVSAESGYLQQYEIPLLSGSYFALSENTEVLASNRFSIILNETAARLLGWSATEAVGQVLAGPIPFMESGEPFTVVGVVQDTNYSARVETIPLIYVAPVKVSYGFLRGRLNVKLSGKNIAAALQHIDDTWKKFFPQTGIARSFLDDRLQAQYRSEALQARLFTGAAVFAVLIACFGLYGLTTFTTERRYKEISVRKVMGSGVWRIVLLLTAEFSTLVLLSNLLAWPLAWFSMRAWLENFAHRIDLTPLLFVISSLLALCVAWVTVASIATKAARTKPVLALRYE